MHYRDCEHPQMSLGDELLQSKDLEVLDLSYCFNLHKLPEKLGSLGNLSSLFLDFCDLKVLPNSLRQLTNLKTLSLSDVSNSFQKVKSFSGKNSNVSQNSMQFMVIPVYAFCFPRYFHFEYYFHQYDVHRWV